MKPKKLKSVSHSKCVPGDSCYRKARERVLKAAKRWKVSAYGSGRYDDSLCNRRMMDLSKAIDHLTRLEKNA